MSDRLTCRIARAVQRMARASGGRILVEQDGQQVVIADAVFSRTTYEVTDSSGNVQLRHTDRDFLVVADRWRIAGKIVDPKDGARITVLEQTRNPSEVYEVMPPPGMQSVERCDPQGYVIRVRTKKV